MYVSKRKTETKGESFERIATARVNKISIMIRRLSNCSTASNYAFTEKQVEKIFDYLQHELDKAKGRFNAVLQNRNRFSLEEPEIKEEYPTLELELPNGASMRVKAINDENWPAMKVEVFEDGEWCVVSETEYTEENESPMNIGICIYERGCEDSVAYIPYKNHEKMEGVK